MGGIRSEAVDLAWLVIRVRLGFELELCSLCDLFSIALLCFILLAVPDSNCPLSDMIAMFFCECTGECEMR